MVLSETRGLLLSWVVRGSIRCPVRLLRLNPAWILTLEPERSVTVGPHHHGSAFPGPCALKLLVASDARRRTLLLSSRSSARWRRSCVPASSAPSLAACLWPAAPDKNSRNTPARILAVVAAALNRFFISWLWFQFSPRISAGLCFRSTCPLTTRYSPLSRVSNPNPQ